MLGLAKPEVSEMSNIKLLAAEDHKPYRFITNEVIIVRIRTLTKDIGRLCEPNMATKHPISLKLKELVEQCLALSL